MALLAATVQLLWCTRTSCIYPDSVVLLQTPDFYANTPPAPAGLTWWHYRVGVPPLPQPAAYFGLSNWTDWGWQYDSDYTVPFYQFSNLDKVWPCLLVKFKTLQLQARVCSTLRACFLAWRHVVDCSAGYATSKASMHQHCQ